MRRALVVVAALFALGCSTTFSYDAGSFAFTSSILDVRIGDKSASAGDAAVGVNKDAMSEAFADVAPEIAGQVIDSVMAYLVGLGATGSCLIVPPTVIDGESP